MTLRQLQVLAVSPGHRRLMIAAATLAATAGPALAQVATSKTNSQQPIEITADQLTVRQQDNLAIFKGNVDAVQGDSTLKSDELRVFYSQAEGQGQTPGGSDTSIRRIEAQGHVLLTRPDQTASGDTGNYDVPAGRVTMIGNVVLTSAQNIVRGGHLDWDLNSGVANVTPAPAGESGRGQRVRALFQPQQRQKER